MRAKWILIVAAAVLAWPVYCGCSHRPGRAECGDVIPEQFPKWLLDKARLPQKAYDGSSPEQVRERFLGKIRAGDAQAAAEALHLVRSAVVKDGGLFSADLSEVGVAALRVNLDTGFIYTLVRHIPNENCFYYRKSSDTRETWGFVYGVGRSLEVLKTVPRAAFEQLLRAIADVPNDPYAASCFLESIRLLQIAGGVLPEEAAARVLALYKIYPKAESVEACVKEVLYRFYVAECGYGEPPPNLKLYDGAVRQAESGQVDQAWQLLRWLIDRSRLQVGALRGLTAGGLSQVSLQRVCVVNERREIRLDLVIDVDTVVPLRFHGIRDLRANLSMGPQAGSCREWLVRAMKTADSGDMWQVSMRLGNGGNESLEFWSTKIELCGSSE